MAKRVPTSGNFQTHVEHRLESSSEMFWCPFLVMRGGYLINAHQFTIQERFH